MSAPIQNETLIRLLYRTSSRTLLATIILTLALTVGDAQRSSVEAQARTIPESMRAHAPPRQKLSGPRFGMTTFTGEIAQLRRDYGQSAFMSQFGWQFENQIVSTEAGHQALMEFVVLLGGFEQSMRNLSVSWLAGYRLPNGFEFGAGPNFGVPLHEGGRATTSMVTAAGATMPFGEIYVPMNLAVAWAPGGPRITTLMGWIIGG